MDKTQIEELVKQLKAAGLDEEKIMSVFYDAFKEKKMDRKDLEVLANVLGFELTDDFKEDETPDPINVEDKGEEITKEELEDAKTIDKNETTEEFKESIEDIKEDDSDAEWKEAQKLFRI